VQQQKRQLMKKVYLLIIALTMLGMMSCSEEELIERREDKIIGSWRFEKAFFTGNNALFRDNITHLVEDDIITFHYDYSATYDDGGQRLEYVGDWLVVLETYTDPDGVENVYFLDALFYGDRTSDDFGFYAEIMWLTQNKMTITFYDNDGEYTYKLEKI
jgi:hypothetical protein